MDQLRNKSVIDFPLGLSVSVGLLLYSNLDQANTSTDGFAWTYLCHVPGLTHCAPWFVVLVGVIALVPFRWRLFQETSKQPLLHRSKASAKG